MKKSAVDKYGSGMLGAINKGYYKNGGPVYLEEGGISSLRDEAMKNRRPVNIDSNTYKYGAEEAERRRTNPMSDLRSWEELLLQQNDPMSQILGSIFDTGNRALETLGSAGAVGVNLLMAARDQEYAKWYGLTGGNSGQFDYDTFHKQASLRIDNAGSHFMNTITGGKAARLGKFGFDENRQTEYDKRLPEVFGKEYAALSRWGDFAAEFGIDILSGKVLAQLKNLKRGKALTGMHKGSVLGDVNIDDLLGPKPKTPIEMAMARSRGKMGSSGSAPPALSRTNKFVLSHPEMEKLYKDYSVDIPWFQGYKTPVKVGRGGAGPKSTTTGNFFTSSGPKAQGFLEDAVNRKGTQAFAKQGEMGMHTTTAPLGKLGHYDVVELVKNFNLETARRIGGGRAYPEGVFDFLNLPKSQRGVDEIEKIIQAARKKRSQENFLQEGFLPYEQFDVQSNLYKDRNRGFAAGGTVPGFSAGGKLPVRGTDTVPAMLTPGEFVMRKSAVDKYGTGFMSAINNGVQRFAKGGPVQYLKNGSNNPVSAGSSGGLFAGVGDIVSSISDSLSAFTTAFSLFSGLSNILSNTINSMADMTITHKIKIHGTLHIPGFSQSAINNIVNTISNEVVEGVDEKIKRAFDQRDRRNDNRTDS